jgi:murein L,D-transpeptidase YafK
MLTVCRHVYVVFLVAILNLVPWSLSSALEGDYELEIYKSKRMLVVKNGPKVERQFRVALGKGGDGDKHHAGDRRTPVGVYRISKLKESKFNHFMLLNYPNVKDAYYGYKDGVITREDFDRIVNAHNQHELPPQDTRLGGAIGIHGLAEESMEALEIQTHFNWTAGCIALENQDLAELKKYVGLGTRVVINE